MLRALFSGKVEIIDLLVGEEVDFQQLLTTPINGIAPIVFLIEIAKNLRKLKPLTWATGFPVLQLHGISHQGSPLKLEFND